jgi:hypothetical protein
LNSSWKTEASLDLSDRPGLSAGLIRELVLRTSGRGSQTSPVLVRVLDLGLVSQRNRFDVQVDDPGSRCRKRTKKKPRRKRGSS